MSGTNMRKKERKKKDLIEIHVCSIAQLCLILCDPMDCSPPASSVHGVLQARFLDWAVMPDSKRSF